jgi:mono/diheme cytochrome c family protein
MTTFASKSFLALALLAAAPLALSVGCTRPQPGPAVVITPEDQAEAERTFTARCLTCHGAKGAGDGPASAGLAPRPRNFQDKMWQSNVTDKHIEMIIQFGGVAVGKSPAMPPNPDLVSKPGVVAALRAHIRSFGK